MTRGARGCLVAALAAVVLVCVAAALLAPTALREGRKFYEPIAKMKEAERGFEAMVERRAWKKPDHVDLTAEQLDRFLAARRGLARLHAEGGVDLDELRGQHEPTSVGEVGEIVRGVGDLVSGQLGVLTAADIPPAEFRYVERIVYETWRPALQRDGTYPAAAARAAAELERAAGGERSPQVAQRLRELAAELRARRPPAPAGVPDAVHALLLERWEEIERWSLDEYGGRSLEL